jgi:hypothetical protein
VSDVNILGFGCAVTFTAIAGAYVYIRECYMAEGRKVEAKREETAVEKSKLRDVA